MPTRKTPKTKFATVQERRIAEVVAEFRWLANASHAEIRSVYSFGEPDFDPTEASENAMANLVDRYAKLTGLGWDDAVSALHQMTEMT